MTLSLPMSPKDVLGQVAQALPQNCRQDVIIVGSLAAGYHYFSEDGSKGIRTKDVDCMFSPHAKAVAAAVQVTDQLLKANWTQREGAEWNKAGGPEDDVTQLAMVRLKPPAGSEWFIELLGAPDAYQPGAAMKQYHRVTTNAGDFAICSFGFLALAEWKPLPTQLDIRIARPEMMALANMLHHETIGPDIMTGTTWKRSNKDLGRVLALAHLSFLRDRKNGSTDFDEWAQHMWTALNVKFPGEARALAQRAGKGVRLLLDSPGDFDQALHICNVGLLTSLDVGRNAFEATGRRFIAEVLEPLAQLAEGA